MDDGHQEFAHRPQINDILKEVHELATRRRDLHGSYQDQSYIPSRPRRIDNYTNSGHSQQRIHFEGENVEEALRKQEEREIEAILQLDEQLQQTNSPGLSTSLINNSTNRNPETGYSHQIIDIQREMEQQAIRRQGERELASIIRQDEFRRPIAREMFYTLTNYGPETGYSQQIIDLQKEIEQRSILQQEKREIQAIMQQQDRGQHPNPRELSPRTIIDMQWEIEQQRIRRQEEISFEAMIRQHPNGPHMPLRDSSNISHTEADNSHEIINLQRRRRHPYDLPSAPNIRPNLFIDIQKGIEQQAIRRQEERNLEAIMRLHPNGPYMPPRLINSSAISGHAEPQCGQHMIGVRDEIDQQGFRYREELLPYPGAPHLPSRLVNISTNSSSVYSRPWDSVIGASSSSLNYPNAPPLTPESDMLRHLRFPDRQKPKDDGLPSYEEAVAFDSISTNVMTRLY